MGITVRGIHKAFLVSVCVSLMGCAGFSPNRLEHGIVIEPATLPDITETSRALRNLPVPVGKIASAVYGFRDLTGQNKPAPASGLSSAVTQGAETVLIKALLDSGWFSVVERTGLQNLLTERELWNKSLRKNGGTQTLAPLPPASIIIEGGIIGYDFNIRTGGSGAKYLGIGANQTYREDVVSINLRAVNSRTGAIIHSVDSTKTLFSKSIGASVFGFVSFDTLLELESGYAYNESVQRGVVEAVESAVINLILEGVLSGTWQLQDPQQITAQQWARFLDSNKSSKYLAEVQKSATERSVVKKPSVENPSEENLILEKTQETDVPVIEEDKPEQQIVPQTRAPGIEASGGEVLITEISEQQALELQRQKELDRVRAEDYRKKAIVEEQQYQERFRQRRLAAAATSATPQFAQSEAVNQPPSSSSSGTAEKVATSVTLLAGDFTTKEEVDTWSVSVAQALPRQRVGVAANPEINSYKVVVGPLRTQDSIDQVIAALRDLSFEQVQMIRNYE